MPRLETPHTGKLRDLSGEKVRKNREVVRAFRYQARDNYATREEAFCRRKVAKRSRVYVASGDTEIYVNNHTQNTLFQRLIYLYEDRQFFSPIVGKDEHGAIECKTTPRDSLYFRTKAVEKSLIPALLLLHRMGFDVRGPRVLDQVLAVVTVVQFRRAELLRKMILERITNELKPLIREWVQLQLDIAVLKAGPSPDWGPKKTQEEWLREDVVPAGYYLESCKYTCAKDPQLIWNISYQEYHEFARELHAEAPDLLLARFLEQKEVHEKAVLDVVLQLDLKIYQMIVRYTRDCMDVSNISLLAGKHNHPQHLRTFLETGVLPRGIIPTTTRRQGNAPPLPMKDSKLVKEQLAKRLFSGRWKTATGNSAILTVAARACLVETHWISPLCLVVNRSDDEKTGTNNGSEVSAKQKRAFCLLLLPSNDPRRCLVIGVPSGALGVIHRDSLVDLPPQQSPNRALSSSSSSIWTESSGSFQQKHKPGSVDSYPAHTVKPGAIVRGWTEESEKDADLLRNTNERLAHYNLSGATPCLVVGKNTVVLTLPLLGVKMTLQRQKGGTLISAPQPTSPAKGSMPLLSTRTKITAA